MTPELKRVVWAYLPGVVAGFMPLFVFLLVRSQAAWPAGMKAEEAWRHLCTGLNEHFVVFSIVTSTVSTFTSFPRLFSYRRDEAPMGGASLFLIMSMTLILVISVASYTLQEAGVTDTTNLVPAIVLGVTTLIVSFYMELAIANVSLERGGVRAT